jgi:hypothetical protein
MAGSIREPAIAFLKGRIRGWARNNPEERVSQALESRADKPRREWQAAGEGVSTASIEDPSDTQSVRRFNRWGVEAVSGGDSASEFRRDIYMRNIRYLWRI